MKKIKKEIVECLLIENKLGLQPCQSRICIPIIDRMYRKMISGIKFENIVVYENTIVNGHHRYIAAHLAGKTIGISEGGSPFRQITDWGSIILEEEDWENQIEITKHNRRDAAYNGLTVEMLMALIG